MRFILLLLLAISLPITSAQAENNKKIELKLNVRKGFLPESRGSSCIYLEEISGGNGDSTIKGIPANWKNPKTGKIDINLAQKIYYRALEKQVAEEQIKAGYAELKLDFDTAYLTRNPVICSVTIASGEDEQGNIMAVLDSDNNQDFSNDTPFIVEEASKSYYLENEELLKTAKTVTYERYVKGTIISESIPLLIYYFKELEKLTYFIPLHMHTPFRVNKRDYDLTVQFDDRGESNLYIKSNPVGENNLSCGIGEYIEIGDSLYKYVGINILKRTLKLEEVKEKPDTKNAQVGYEAIPFKGLEFTTGEELTLDSFKGKYLLIDFWGTWCGVCLNEMPDLISAYSKLDKNKYAILGIVKDTPAALANLLKKNNIGWQQIISDSENRIIEKYNISNFPTNFVIDPEGKIIAKDVIFKDFFKDK